jgi:hypothetical protein
MDIVRKERPQNGSPEQVLLESAFAKDRLFDGIRPFLSPLPLESPANTRNWFHP